MNERNPSPNKHQDELDRMKDAVSKFIDKIETRDMDLKQRVAALEMPSPEKIQCQKSLAEMTVDIGKLKQARHNLDSREMSIHNAKATKDRLPLGTAIKKTITTNKNILKIYMSARKNYSDTLDSFRDIGKSAIELFKQCDKRQNEIETTIEKMEMQEKRLFETELPPLPNTPPHTPRK